MDSSPSTWAERHPVISGLLTFVAMLALALIGVSALALFVEMARDIIEGFWQLLQPQKGKP